MHMNIMMMKMMMMKTARCNHARPRTKGQKIRSKKEVQQMLQIEEK